MKIVLRKFQVFFFVMFSAMVMAATIKGRVLDETNSPIIGASIGIKGQDVGTVTDIDGNFEISANVGDVITVSFLGYEEYSVKVASTDDVLEITMNPSENMLQEVVMTAMAPSKRSTFTGSDATISAKDISNRPITNVLQALSGAASGVNSTAGGGQPGSNPSIRLRGFGSINASSDPLYVVDGQPFSGNINNLSPSDIESITVLKDAASTALYGARAANGVINITTKKGQAGPAKIDIKYTYGTNSRGVPEYDRIEAPDYYTLMWEANRNSLAYRATTPVSLVDAGKQATAGLKALVGYNVYNVPDAELVNPDGVFNPNAKPLYPAEAFDWQAPLIRPSNRNEVNLSIGGGDKTTTYYLSANYLDDKGFIKRSDFTRYSARLNVNSQVKSYLKTGINISTTVSKSGLADADGNTSFVNPFFFTRVMAPIYPVYAYDPKNPGQFLTNADGSRMYDIGNMSALGLANRPQNAGRHAVYETELNQNFFDRNFLAGRAFAEFKFLKNFKFTTSLGADMTDFHARVYGNAIVGDAAPSGRATNAYSKTFSINFNQNLQYSNTFGNHGFDVLLGHESYDERFNNVSGSRSGQILEGNLELINFTTTTDLTSTQNDRRVEGFFSRISYDYLEKYILTLSARRDGSSRFFNDVRWGNFYSVGAAWAAHKEPFIKNLDLFSNLKFRANLGQTGNDAGISLYAWQALYNLGWNNAGEPGILQGSLGNKQLTWESSNAYDAAIEFGLWDNRISGAAEYFRRESSDLLFNVPLPLSSGVTSQTRNVGTMSNDGWELTLAVSPIKTKDLEWSIFANTTLLNNTILRLPDENRATGIVAADAKKYNEGNSIQDYWLRDYHSINPATGEVLYRAVAYNPANSIITEKNDTLTSNISNAKFHFAGSAIPDYVGGIGTSISYKGFELGVQGAYQIGGLTYDGAYQQLMGAGYHSAKHPDILKRWSKPGDITDVPRMDASRTGDFDAGSDRWLISSTGFVLRNINLSYAFPKSMLSRLKVSDFSIFGSAENMFFATKRKGMNSFQEFSGVTSNTFSTNKAVVIGANISF
jgi:TonB-linked SusC/RagA family outer membrane protein